MLFDVLTEPRGQEYRDLVDALGAFSSTLCVVVRPTLSLSARGQHVLALLGRDSIEVRATSEWPGTKLLGGTACVHSVRVSPLSREVLKSSADGLYDWCQPELPEDVMLLRQDGSLVLASIAHEKDAWLSLSELEHRAVCSTAPGVMALLRAAEHHTVPD